MNEDTIRKECQFELYAEEEIIFVQGNVSASGDDAYDKEIEEEVLNRLNRGDVWAWAAVTVRATWGDFEGKAHLGGCSYQNEADFKSDAYYADMKEEALADLISNRKVRLLTDAAPELLDALQSLMNIEHAAILGGKCNALEGLDITYHFEKARKAINKAEGK